MWVSMLIWPEIDRGHFRAASWVLFPLTIGLSLLLPPEARVAGLAAGGLQAGFLGAVYSQRPLLEWVSGGAASIAIAAPLALSVGTACRGGCGHEFLQATLGVAFLGAVTHGMVLGHWYLNQPRLPTGPLRGAANLLTAGVAASIAAGVATRGEMLGASVPGSILVSSAQGYWWAWLVLAGGVGVLAVMIRSTVGIRSTQSATGLLYVAMIPAIAAQFLANLLVGS